MGCKTCSSYPEPELGRCGPLVWFQCKRCGCFTARQFPVDVHYAKAASFDGSKTEGPWPGCSWPQRITELYLNPPKYVQPKSGAPIRRQFWSLHVSARFRLPTRCLCCGKPVARTPACSRECWLKLEPKKLSC